MGNQSDMKGLAMYAREGDAEALWHYNRTDLVNYGGIVGSSGQIGTNLSTGIFGASRSGKSLCLQSLARLLAVGPVTFRGKSIVRNRAVIFDKHLQFESFCREAGAPESFLFQTYPLAANAHGIDLQAEAKSDLDRRNLAIALCDSGQAGGGNQRFWDNLSSVVLHAVMSTYEERGARWTFADIIRPFVKGTFEHIEHILKFSEDGRMALDLLKSQGMEKLQGHARVSLLVELAQYSELAAATEHHINAGRSWSFRDDFLKGTPLVFLGSPTSSKPMERFVALKQGFLSQTILEDSSRDTATPGFTDPSYLFLDELIGTKVENLAELLREGPKRAFSCAVVIHDLPGLKMTNPGEGTASHLIAQLQGLIITKMHDPETRILLSELLGGKREEWRRSYQTNGMGETSYADSIIERWLIDPSTFSNWPLADFNGFACMTKTPSGYASQNWVSGDMLRTLIPHRRAGRSYEPLDAKHLRLPNFESSDWERLHLPPLKSKPVPSFYDPEDFAS